MDKDELRPWVQRVIDHVGCPKCGVTKGQPCVYLSVAIPSHPKEWYEDRRYSYAYRYKQNPWARYALSGKPMQTVHNERRRINNNRSIEPIERPKSLRGLSEDGYQALWAIRRWDIEEHKRLVEWWREWGWLIENANALRPDGTVRGDTYCFRHDR